ncbi:MULTISPECIES: DUF1419 domain-containing protein [Rhizobium]|uniref:DUF1419 domain-containing protein n=1 Tax=Rhizobium johnstonii (strain DSM 114642 / LMG 32736 / 3841) TaxID=216596 RepID=Q1M9B6_RHIJ3|nr:MULTISPECIES: DUF1419 domain-containing protein [Rhizobium]MBX5160856.1 DUF1419 domain-containing protein [Rhizobium sp. NZLR8]TBC12948.1 DUF1419 domain-containing protein [Rhizobium ruizarguesonis]TBE38584.1 DUF1419 domain-containing protein [Rhizobium leguminosarum]CAK02904.1 conserved hypothetical protein [Rhizobium johnstonii 3841]
MNTPAPIRKIFEGVATRPQMFRLFDRHSQRPDRWRSDAAPLYSGEWFELDEALYDYMLNILPPLWMCGPIFALREFLTGSTTSIFLALRIDGKPRYFHGYCDLSDPTSVETMRATIFERETQPVHAMSREELLEHIWSSTTNAYRGYAGDRFPPVMQGQRMVMLWSGTNGTLLKLLDDLTDDETAAKLPVHMRHLPDIAA